MLKDLAVNVIQLSSVQCSIDPLIGSLAIQKNTIAQTPGTSKTGTVI